MTTEDINTEVTPGSSGLITIDGATTASYPETVTVKNDRFIDFEAVPTVGYQFDSWSGDLKGNENPVEIRVFHDMVITAHFLPTRQEFTSADEILKATIPAGARALDILGAPLRELGFSIIEAPPPPPEEASIIGPAYRLEPHGATFNPPLGLTWNYNLADIPSDVSEDNLAVAYYDDVEGEWGTLPSLTNKQDHFALASVVHFSTFSLLGFPPPPKPAEFVLASLVIYPEDADISETVFISATVTNTGEVTDIHSITLNINGVTEKTKEIELAGGAEGAVLFTTKKENAGNYRIEINDLSASFSVRELSAYDTAVEPVHITAPTEDNKSSPWLIAIILAAVAVAITFLLLRRRHRHFRHRE
ncbi:hypothetical protein ACFLTJ_01840 [Chloroflexota bacterium]